jgi:elongation factor Ts
VTITASQVKELRDLSGAGMMDCKKALQESGGDLEAAQDFLRKKGLATAEKRRGRETNEGLIRAHVDGRVAGLVEINCETDFVSRNEEFEAFASALARCVAANDFASREELLAFSLDATTVQDRLTDLIGKIGENMVIPRFARITLDGPGLIEPYLHAGGRVGVIVAVGAPSDETAARPEFREIAHDLALHIAFASPLSLDRDGVPADQVERERRISRERALEQGKPEKIVDKIVEGQIGKYFAQVVLLEQPFVKEDKASVIKWLEQSGKALGGTPVVRAYARFALGETDDEA